MFQDVSAAGACTGGFLFAYSGLRNWKGAANGHQADEKAFTPQEIRQEFAARREPEATHCPQQAEGLHAAARLQGLVAVRTCSFTAGAFTHRRSSF